MDAIAASDYGAGMDHVAPATGIAPRASANAGEEARAMLALAWPLVAANLLQMAVYAIDVMFVARLGESALAASSLGIAIYGLIQWTLTGFVGACAPLIAAEIGRRRHAVREVRRSLRMALWLGVLASLLGMAICWNGERILLLTGQGADVSARAGGFLRILMWALVPAIMAATLRILVATLGSPRIATVITAMALLTNALGNWLLVFGHWGFPALGLNGSAISSVITTLLMLAAYLAVILKMRKFRRYRLLGRWWRADWSRFADLVRLGLPIALTVLAEGGLFNSAALLIGQFGETALAAHTLALQIAALAFQVPFGIAQAATIRVGLAYGARDPAWIALAGRVALLCGIGFMALTALAMWIAPRLFLSLYVDPGEPANAALVALAVQYLAVAAAFQLFDGAQTVAAGALRGLQDTRTPMLMAVGGYWLAGFVAAVWLGLWTPLAGLGVWLGLAIGLVVVSALLLWRWHWRERLGLVPAQKIA